MSRVFRQQYTRPIPADAERVTVERRGRKVPGVRFRGPDGKAILAPLTRNGTRCRVASPTWYGRVDGAPVPLCANKSASELMLAELVKKAELARRGICDRFEQHRKRPLTAHLTDWESSLRANGLGQEYIALKLARVRGGSRRLQVCVHG